MDTFGQVAVLGPDRDLVGMFHFFRDKAAAWLPDGTRIGPLPVIGGPPTPDGSRAHRQGARRGPGQGRARGQVSTWGRIG